MAFFVAAELKKPLVEDTVLGNNYVVEGAQSFPLSSTFFCARSPPWVPEQFPV